MSMIGLLTNDSNELIAESRGERHLTQPFFRLPEDKKKVTPLI
jgi:hypothetical protein